MLKKNLQKIVNEKQGQNIPNFVIINLLKEYLQFPILSYLYNSQDYKDFIFTGGSCLRICYGLPRLSEDLDFDLFAKDFKKIDLKKLANDLMYFFDKNYLIKIEFKEQLNKRLYLKFPILKDLGIAKNISESNFLYVKLEFFQSDYAKPKIELNPISAFGYNFVTKNYTLEYLMTGKIRALLNRTWFKGSQNEVNIKGRDFYDLFWYFQKGISPSYYELNKLEKIKNENELKRILRERIERNITPRKLSYDLKNFFTDQVFIDDFCKNYKIIIKKYLDA